MPNESFDWQLLQDVFARGAPVVAIGPGCHRIGYDKTLGWTRVVQRAGSIWHRLGELEAKDEVEPRQRFLERFWAAQLCDNAHGGQNGTAESSAPELPAELSIRDRPKGESAPEAARIALATDLLCGLIEATRLLGATIETGAEPVMDWQHLIADLNGDETTARHELLARARDRLGEARDLADDMKAVQMGGVAGERDFQSLERCGLSRGDAKVERLPLLKVREIKSALEKLLDNRFQDNGDRVSGAVVEWLSDLFWNVVVSGAGVPLSQGELSFHLNLHELEYSSRRFSRSHPGEYRGPKDKGETLHKNLKELLRNYDSGQDDRLRDWTQPREAFACTMALSLVKAWRKGNQGRFTIALVSDYDLMLERALTELLKGDEQFHVITPATVEAERGQVKYEWLLGTFGGDDGDRGPLAEPSWEWLNQRRKLRVNERLGPIVIRLTGTPLFELGPDVEEQLVETHEPDEIFRVRPAAVFSEHDSVQAILALTPPRQPGTQSEIGFREELLFQEKGLTWDRRCWLFFGHRFSDWLPRLQLLITALMLARGEGAQDDRGRGRGPLEKAHKIAISRRFDWPEQALLNALEIEMEAEDLGAVSKYFDPEEPQEEETAEFLREMREEPCGLPAGSASMPFGSAGSRPDRSSGLEMEPKPKVFISYSHEKQEGDGWKEDVRKFARVLSDSGLMVKLDQVGTHVDRDWNQWGPTELAASDYVVCPASPRYREEWDKAEGGKRGGAAIEAQTIRELWRDGRVKVLFVLLPGRSCDDIPDSFRGKHFEKVESIDPDGVEGVVRQITGQPSYEEFEPGPLRKLPPKE
jgi:hypothetical protein